MFGLLSLMQWVCRQPQYFQSQLYQKHLNLVHLYLNLAAESTPGQVEFVQVLVYSLDEYFFFKNRYELITEVWSPRAGVGVQSGSGFGEVFIVGASMHGRWWCRFHCGWFYVWGRQWCRFPIWWFNIGRLSLNRRIGVERFILKKGDVEGGVGFFGDGRIPLVPFMVCQVRRITEEDALDSLWFEFSTFMGVYMDKSEATKDLKKNITNEM